MRRIRIAAGASLGVLALVTSSLAAGAAPARTEGSATVRRVAQPEGAAEYVIAYQGDATAAAEATAAAGGQVVDVNEDLGIALVTSSAPGFLADVQATEAVVGAARNHSVGTAAPGRAHRFADERPTAAEVATQPSTAAGAP
ncbi:MAG TPA: hypothetical protein VFI47_01265, partial [Acidimicrobiales bacterium]|nr:hypothetical protein [Acidimicrobiales bacterium]